MAGEVAQRVNVRALVGEERDPAVAEDVQAGLVDPRHPLDPIQRRADAMLGVLGVLAVGVVTLPVQDATPEPVETGQHGPQVGREADLGDGPLRGSFGPAEDRPSHVDHPVLEVDVLPAQGRDLAGAQSRLKREDENRRIGRVELGEGRPQVGELLGRVVGPRLGRHLEALDDRDRADVLVLVRPPEHLRQLGEHEVDRAGLELLRRQVRGEPVDHALVDGRKRHVAERAQVVPPQGGVGRLRRLALEADVGRREVVLVEALEGELDARGRLPGRLG